MITAALLPSRRFGSEFTKKSLIMSNFVAFASAASVAGSGDLANTRGALAAAAGLAGAGTAMGNSANGPGKSDALTSVSARSLASREFTAARVSARSFFWTASLLTPDFRLRTALAYARPTFVDGSKSGMSIQPSRLPVISCQACCCLLCEPPHPQHATVYGYLELIEVLQGLAISLRPPIPFIIAM